MRRDLLGILFHADLGRDGQPLFKSQTDLARAVMDVKGGGFGDRKEGSVRAFINQVLKGDRPLSPNLRKCITEAVKERLVAGLDVSDVLTELEQAFVALRDPDRVELPLDDRDEFDALRSEGEKAHVHFITTFQPAELTDSTKAAELREQLAENLGLSADVESSTEPGRQYIFNFPSEAVAMGFWSKLTEFLVYTKRIGDAADRLRRIEESPHPALQVFVQDPRLCVFPSVIYNPTSPTRTGFVLYYHGTNRVSIARMSADALHEWFHRVYLPVTEEPAKNHRIRVKWSDCVSAHNLTRNI